MLLRSIFAVVTLFATFPAFSNAQHYQFETYQPLIQRSNRALGLWHGRGRHWRTPGHDSSYYNPWTPRNSALVTQGYNQTLNSAPIYYPPQDSLYPAQPVAPNPLLAPPLGGSYSPFGDDDIDEKVPEIEPVEGGTAPGPRELPGPKKNQSQFNFSDEIYLHSTQRRPAQSTQAASIVEWTEIK